MAISLCQILFTVDHHNTIYLMIELETIRRCFESNTVWYSHHARIEMRSEEFGPIDDEEVYQAICSGEMLEEYPDDTPYPSLLIFGKTKENRPLHVVCAYNQLEDVVITVTVYEPNPQFWVDFKRRRT